MIRQALLLLCMLLPAVTFSQIEGKVIDNETNQPIIGVKITSTAGEKTISDDQGNFFLKSTVFPVALSISMPTYVTDTIVLSNATSITIRLKVEVRSMESVVVTASRRSQRVEDVPISMEIIKPALIANKGITDLEQAVDQSPGVYAMDGQVSIRGGGGYSYGAGSRVLLLWNGVPMVSPDLGDAKWNAVPMENASQIEILKGASSVLYGSGALNGIISLTENDPTNKLQIRARVQSGVYGDPKRESLKWWTKNPTFHTADFFLSKMHKQFGYSVSLNGYTNDGFRKGEVEDRVRLNGAFVYKPINNKRLKLGLNYNAQYQYQGAFILWESDSLGYIALGGQDPHASGSSISYQRAIRVNVDPYLKYIDKKENKHELKTRYYLVTTGNETNVFASSKAEMYYADYQVQHKFKNKSAITFGGTSLNNRIVSSVFGDHLSINFAAYTQYELKWKKLDVTGGLRLEYFQQDSRKPDSKIEIGSTSIPISPIVRFGLHYPIAKYTHLRASFGQGIRFPSVAERYAATSVGGVIIFPNEKLNPEKGWAAEIGFKQGVKMGEWKGFFDVAGFINQYSNMMEFTFGLYPPDTITLSFNPDDIGYIKNWIGFQAKNSEKARITGIETSFASDGKIGEVGLQTLIGYTYMNPISLNKDSAYMSTFSDSGTNMLKYRFKHLAKIDIEASYKNWSLGTSMRYNSYMSNIDAPFEDGFLGQDFLVGLKDYRERNQHGSLVFDARVGYKFADHYRVGFMVNNLLNAEYVSRPADIQAPRTFLLQLQFIL